MTALLDAVPAVPGFDMREAKEAVRSMFDSPETLPQVVAGLWLAQVQLFQVHVQRGALDEEKQHAILSAIIANGRGLSALGIAGGAMKAGNAVSLTLTLGGADPGDGDELTVG